jgi:hypothetical protein
MAGAARVTECSAPREEPFSVMPRSTSVRTLFLAVPAAAALLILPSASAKDFGPGDLRVCNATRCVAIVNQEVLPQLGSFYYSGPALRPLRRPPLGVPYYELRFRNDYVTGIVATRRLNRFLSYGVHLERFARDRWYAVPRSLSGELRRLTVGLRPLRLTRAALARSR